MLGAAINYDEITVRIEPVNGGYVVRATSSEGEAHAPFDLPLSRDRIDYLVLKAAMPRRGRRRMESSALADVTELGDTLFKALFRDEVRDLYRTAHAIADSRGNGLRVKLSLTDVPELMALPWEFLYDEPSFLSISQLTPVVRYLELPRSRPVPEVKPPLRILAMVSSPTDAPELDVQQERANLEQALADLDARGLVELRWLEHATLAALLEELRNADFHIFHYIGHGAFNRSAQDGVLLLEDDQERGHEVSSRRLGTILHDHRTLRLAVVNACEGARSGDDDPFAGVAATLIQQGIPAVIAMQFEITDRAAIVFARHLYDALADGLAIDSALAEARKAIWADDNDVEWATPVLFMRVADGRLFDVRPLDVPPPPITTRLTVRLDAPAEVEPGAEATLHACVENHGDAAAVGLSLRDGGGRQLVDAFDLAPGEARMVTWTTRPTTDETHVVTVADRSGAGGGAQASAVIRVVDAAAAATGADTPTPTPPAPPGWSRRWVLAAVSTVIIVAGTAAFILGRQGTAVAGWQRLPDLPVAVDGAGAAAYDGRVWVAGGVAPDQGRTKLASVYVYDPGTRVWTPGPALPTALDHAALVSTGAHLYVLGGFGSAGSVQTVYRLDSPTGTWQSDTPLPEPRGAGAAAWDGSRIVFAGGVAPDHTDKADIWALEAGRWQRIGNLQRPRDKLAAATDHLSSVWFLAGRDEAAGGLVYPLVDVVSNNTVTTGGTVPAVQGAAAIGVGSGFCMIAGQTSTGFTGRIECHGTSPSVATLKPPRAGLGAAVIGPTVYVIGGYTAAQQGLAIVEAVNIDGAH